MSLKTHANIELNMMKNERKYVHMESLRYCKKMAHKEDRQNAKHIITEALINELH